LSVDAPSLAIAFGSVSPPQGDVVRLTVHLGCTREVSSYEAVLQNWNGKYSPNGTYPISVGLDGNISLGRGVNCPLLMTCRVESVKYQSTPLENYVTVSGRCWGERLFRRVVSKTYASQKGEEIVTDLMDYYVGLSHVRGLHLGMAGVKQPNLVSALTQHRRERLDAQRRKCHHLNPRAIGAVLLQAVGKQLAEVAIPNIHQKQVHRLAFLICGLTGQ